MTHSVVLVLGDPESPAVNMRCAAFGSFMGRLRMADGRGATLVTGPADPASSMAGIATAAALLGENGDVHYVPTRAARDRVVAEEDGAWPLSVASRQRKVVRRSTGAIFRFPVETAGPAGQAEATPVEAFVTDWTGMPAPCAMVIHPAHPLSTGIAPGERASFTGRYCRNPLTGDLLPIWVADWVKPDFGTGAVVVNPGHNKVDLEFSRQVGLPIRFALAPEGFDGSPVSWLEPPFIKSGVAIRTGIADGLAYDRARDAYIALLVERGLAEVYSDSGMGRFLVATADPGGAAEVPWDDRRRTIVTAGHAGELVRLAPSSLLSAAEERVRGAELTVVAPSTRVESDLLALRLLLAEPDIEPPVKSAPEILLVGNTLPVKEEVDDGVLRLAMLVNAGALDTVALKPQQIEPAERFLRAHAALSRIDPVAGSTVAPDVGKTASRVKSLLGALDLKQAFTHLYRMQKGLTKSENVGQPDLLCYLALAHVLAGVSGPYDEETLTATWQQI